MVHLKPSSFTDLKKAVEAIDLYFRSGNSVPITKAHIPKTEWDALTKALKEALNAR